jgi:hypothetical protein
MLKDGVALLSMTLLGRGTIGISLEVSLGID